MPDIRDDAFDLTALTEFLRTGGHSELDKFVREYTSRNQRPADG